MSEPVILVLLAALVMALLLVPFFRRRDGAMPPTRAASIPRVEVVDDDPSATALREIDLDRQMGKLSEADYLALKAKYEAARQSRPARSEAVAPDGAGAVMSASPSPARAEGLTRQELEQRAEGLVRRWRQESVRCPDCGDRPEPDARYCSNCGRVLVPCPGCGSSVNEPAARFCICCGAALAA